MSEMLIISASKVNFIIEYQVCIFPEFFSAYNSYKRINVNVCIQDAAEFKKKNIR